MALMLEDEAAPYYGSVRASGFGDSHPPALPKVSGIGERLAAGHVVALDDPIASTRFPVEEIEFWLDAGLYYFVPCLAKEGVIAVLAVGRKDTGEPRNLNLRCGVILFQQPEAPHKSQMLIAASDAGPVISLWDSQEKGRLVLSVEQDDPQVILHTAEGKEAVLFRANPADGRGFVIVFDNGHPRAVMKAGPDNAGVVSVGFSSSDSPRAAHL